MSAVSEPVYESTTTPTRQRSGGGSGLSVGPATIVIVAADLVLVGLCMTAFTLGPAGAAATLLALGGWAGLAALLSGFVAAVIWRWRRRPDDSGGGNGGGPPDPGGWWWIVTVLLLTAIGIVVGFAVAYWYYYPAIPGAHSYPGRLDALHAVHGSLSTLATLGEGVDPCPLASCLKPTGLLVTEMIQAVVGLVFLSGAVSLALAAVADRMR